MTDAGRGRGAAISDRRSFWEGGSALGSCRGKGLRSRLVLQRGPAEQPPRDAWSSSTAERGVGQESSKVELFVKSKLHMEKSSRTVEALLPALSSCYLLPQRGAGGGRLDGVLSQRPSGTQSDQRPTPRLIPRLPPLRKAHVGHFNLASWGMEGWCGSSMTQTLRMW